MKDRIEKFLKAIEQNPADVKTVIKFDNGDLEVFTLEEILNLIDKKGGIK